ncbi:MAG TPA: glycosyltransferase family 4 protein [Vicinamibacterales bacterium]|nr:glycosyltransferase family 4 protein [Vicinamibacterales bacterium]
MKICHVAPELLPVPPTRGGAIERWIRDAATRLAARGHDVHVISRDGGDGNGARIIDGVHYHYVRIAPAIDRGLAAVMFRGLRHYLGAKSLLASIQPDIVHHHSRPAGLWLSQSGARHATQVISLHSMEYGWAFGYAGWDRRVFNRGFNAAARVLGVSNFIRSHVEARYPAVRSKSQTVYNGVDGQLFKPQGELADPPILYVGRVESRKGVHVLVDAFERVISKQRPHARLRIVGPHSYWDERPSAYYQALAKRCAGNPRIELRGPTFNDQELAAVYRDSACTVVPSTFPEALGLTSLEAQASGVPVVVSNAGGLPETVDAGKSGLVFENGNAAQLGEAVLSIIGNADRRRGMGKAARERIMKIFSWDVIAGELERTYAEAIAA